MKIDRIEVYNKYGCHCAYCGHEIEYDGMQVDHLTPKRARGSDDFGNLMPPAAHATITSERWDLKDTAVLCRRYTSALKIITSSVSLSDTGCLH